MMLICSGAYSGICSGGVGGRDDFFSFQEGSAATPVRKENLQKTIDFVDPRGGGVSPHSPPEYAYDLYLS